MAKSKQQKIKKHEETNFVKIDAYMIPAPQAEMYRVLREAVAQDVIDELSKQYTCVERIQDAEEGEAIVAFLNDIEYVRIYLNPSNISLAQKARDKDQMDKFIENFIK